MDKFLTLFDWYNLILANEKYWSRHIFNKPCTQNAELLANAKKCQDFVHNILIVEDQGLNNETNLRISEKRSQHTVSSFLLGVLLKEQLTLDMKTLPRPTGNYNTSFIYFWSMVSLYHDMAYEIEYNSYKNYKDVLTVDDFIKKYKIKYNLLDVSNYSKLFKQYYLYRIENGNPSKNRDHKIDHGICCGILLYNALMKAYYARTNIKTKDELKEDWKCSKAFPEYALLISETIARHNIWEPTDNKIIALYEKYALNKLIKQSHYINKTYESNENLFLLLGIVDTIDPIKALKRKEKTDFLIDIALKNTTMYFNSKNKSFRISNSNYIDEKKYDDWKSLERWLGVDVMYEKSNLQIKVSPSKSELKTA